MVKTRVFALILVLASGWVAAQSLTLEEAQAYAEEHSFMANNASLEVQKARRIVNKTLAQGFPQITANASYINNIELPVQVVPAEFFGGEPGTFAEVKFGTEQTMNWSATLNQLIFDGSYIVGVQGAKTYLRTSRDVFEKTTIELRDIVTQLYAQVLVSRENARILEESVTQLQQLATETKALQAEGFAEVEDVDQLQILLNQTEQQLAFAQNFAEIALEQLKFNIGYPAEDALELGSTLQDLSTGALSLLDGGRDFAFGEHIDYRIQLDQLEQRQLQMKLAQSNYLPRISGVLNVGQNSFSDNRFNFFSNDGTWFTNSYAGVNVSLPLFTSSLNRNNVAEAKLAMQQAERALSEKERELKLNAVRAKANYELAVSNYESSDAQVDLSSRILTKAREKYSEGMTSSLELTQIQNQYLDRQNGYTQAVFNLISAYTELQKALNQQ